MITVTEENSVFRLDVKVRKPSIHLDHWTLRRLSTDENLKFIFLSFFKSKGTLFFSWANVFDIINQDEGSSLERIKLFFSEIGEQWALIKMNPGQVIREEDDPNLTNNPPWFDHDFLKMYYPFIHGGPLTLTRMIDLVNINRQVLKKHQEEHQKEIIKIIEEAKVDFSSSSAILEKYKKLSIEAFESKKFCKAAFRGLLRSIFARRDNFKDSDVVDFFHSVVNLAYADIVFLDKHWKNLAVTIPGYERNVKVYKETELLEFFKFLRTQFSYEGKQLVKKAYEALGESNQ